MSLLRGTLAWGLLYIWNVYIYSFFFLTERHESLFKSIKYAACLFTRSIYSEVPVEWFFFYLLVVWVVLLIKSTRWHFEATNTPTPEETIYISSEFNSLNLTFQHFIIHCIHCDRTDKIGQTKKATFSKMR